ncbi:hypothetical protein K7X08_033263 [Anisodus acutangulus]|uniref:Uncharacterized protein n=1 Tax=Anisodus acutangulus TaxID=402998 RepID=A0A9Q1RBZ4_9SOLA|nr:hypothetical protein K7X08_033263 [Anisodus acutangulus]
MGHVFSSQRIFLPAQFQTIIEEPTNGETIENPAPAAKSGARRTETNIPRRLHFFVAASGAITDIVEDETPLVDDAVAHTEESPIEAKPFSRNRSSQIGVMRKTSHEGNEEGIEQPKKKRRARKRKKLILTWQAKDTIVLPLAVTTDQAPNTADKGETIVQLDQDFPALCVQMNNKGVATTGRPSTQSSDVHIASYSTSQAGLIHNAAVLTQCHARLGAGGIKHFQTL